MHRRVVVTGLGPVSSIGVGIEAFAPALCEGRSRVAPIVGFDASGFPHHMAAEIPDFDPRPLLRVIDPEAWGRTSLFAAAAARLAVADAGLAPGDVPTGRAGCVTGTTSGESQVIERLTAEALRHGWDGVSAGEVPKAAACRLGYAVNRELGFTGEAMTITTACAAGNYALGYAYDLILAGEQDVMVAVGADSLSRWSHAGFYRLGALAERVCAPFDRDRSGIIIGEGGAALVVEELESARRRGARIYAEVLGYGLNCDASHMVAPNPASIAACMRHAHDHAGITAAQVDFVCAHGTGTPTNDKAEATALVEVFGDTPPAVSSIKSMLGHTMGAASAFGAIASVLAIAQGVVPPTINYRTPDPDLPKLDIVANSARKTRPAIVQNNGFAFGGNNAITILGTPR